MTRFLIVGVMVGSLTGPHLAHAGSATAGRIIAEAKCASCHAVGPHGDSPFPPAPAFRDLHQRYDVGALEEALAEGIVSGHPAMPEFTFSPAEISALIAYLRSLDPPAPTKHRASQPAVP